MLYKVLYIIVKPLLLVTRVAPHLVDAHRYLKKGPLLHILPRVGCDLGVVSFSHGDLAIFRGIMTA